MSFLLVSWRATCSLSLSHYLTGQAHKYTPLPLLSVVPVPLALVAHAPFCFLLTDESDVHPLPLLRDGSMMRLRRLSPKSSTSLHWTQPVTTLGELSSYPLCLLGGASRVDTRQARPSPHAGGCHGVFGYFLASFLSDL